AAARGVRRGSGRFGGARHPHVEAPGPGLRAWDGSRTSGRRRAITGGAIGWSCPVFLSLLSRSGMRIGQGQIGAGLVVLGALAIAAATLTPVPGSMGGGTSRICLICHDRGMADFVSNIILFAPLGLGLALLGRRWYFALAVGALCSLTVESLQLDVIAGRDANFGDLVANSLGAVTGWFFGVTRSWWRPTPDRATTRAIGVTVAGSVLLLGALVLLRPAPQEATYYLQWTPALGGGMHVYLGEVTETRIGP